MPFSFLDGVPSLRCPISPFPVPALCTPTYPPHLLEFRPISLSPSPLPFSDPAPPPLPPSSIAQESRAHLLGRDGIGKVADVQNPARAERRKMKPFVKPQTEERRHSASPPPPPLRALARRAPPRSPPRPSFSVATLPPRPPNVPEPRSLRQARRVIPRGDKGMRLDRVASQSTPAR